MRGRTKMQRWASLLVDVATTTSRDHDQQHPTGPHRTYALQAETDDRMTKKSNNFNFRRLDRLRSFGVKLRKNDDEDEESSSSSDEASAMSPSEAAEETSKDLSPWKNPHSRWRRDAVRRRQQRRVDNHSVGNIQDEPDGYVVFFSTLLNIEWE